MNSVDESEVGLPFPADHCLQFPTDEFVEVCEELGLLEPTVNEINEDMWNDIPRFEDSRW